MKKNIVLIGYLMGLVFLIINYFTSLSEFNLLLMGTAYSLVIATAIYDYIVIGENKRKVSEVFQIIWTTACVIPVALVVILTDNFIIAVNISSVIVWIAILSPHLYCILTYNENESN